jgi:hypothetical protein
VQSILAVGSKSGTIQLYRPTYHLPHLFGQRRVSRTQHLGVRLHRFGGPLAAISLEQKDALPISQLVFPINQVRIGCCFFFFLAGVTVCCSAHRTETETSFDEPSLPLIVMIIV